MTEVTVTDVEVRRISTCSVSGRPDEQFRRQETIGGTDDGTVRWEARTSDIDQWGFLDRISSLELEAEYQRGRTW